MSMPERPHFRSLIGVLVAALASIPGGEASAADASGAPRLGHRLTPEQAQRQSLNVFPDGRGLPAGRDTAAEGASAEELAGGEAPLTSQSPDKTIGLYWPYATTIFDFTRRAMPLSAPGSLSNDEIYALTAYLLFENRLIGEREEMNPVTLPRVHMPNRDGFIGTDAQAR